MGPEIQLIYQLSRRAVFETSSRSETDLKAWVANAQYQMENPLVPNAKGRASAFKTRISDVSALDVALANDCNRFSQAAIESMWGVRKIDKLPRSTAWAAVQTYYAAFFAAHSLLRMFGRACTQLEPAHVKRVFELASATSMDGGATSIESGFYSSVESGGCVEFVKLKDSHADTWSEFSRLLAWLTSNIPNTTGLGRQKSDAIDLVSKIKLAVSQANAVKGNWLSQIRNKVNYQHSHGVWYPYKGAVHDCDSVLRNSEWLKAATVPSQEGKGGDIQSLFDASNSILSLMYHLLKFGYERGGKSSSVLTNGTFRLINQIQAA